jgi:hypothetical protein
MQLTETLSLVLHVDKTQEIKQFNLLETSLRQLIEKCKSFQKFHNTISSSFPPEIATFAELCPVVEDLNLAVVSLLDLVGNDASFEVQSSICRTFRTINACKPLYAQGGSQQSPFVEGMIELPVILGRFSGRYILTTHSELSDLSTSLESGVENWHTP